MGLLNVDNCVLVAIDFQEKLVGMLQKDDAAVKMDKLLTAAKILGVPTVVTEQYPQGLGATIPTFDLEGVKVIEKTAFSAMQSEEFKAVLAQTSKKQVIIGGIETHICVHQTVSELLDTGYEVYVVKDACASRNTFEFKQGIEAMKANGAKITCLEIVLFELLRTSKNPNFKPVQALIK